MSFSSETKNWISRHLTSGRCCQMAEFLALTKSDGTIGIYGRDGLVLAITSENAAVAKKIYKLSRELFAEPGKLLVYKNNRLKKNNRYEIRIPYQDDIKPVFIRLGIMDGDGTWGDFSRNRFPWESLEKDCCKRSYLRGAFLGSGSVNSPEREYHLEIVSSYLEHAEGLKQLLHDLGMESKIFLRKNQYVVYMKNADGISAFLQNIGAHNALLTFESERVMKDVRNNANRMANSDCGNLNKIANSSADQKEAILKIQRSIGLDNLSPALREAALLRLDNIGVSLSELGELADPPVGKSGMSHRMKKLKEIAERL